MWKDPENIINIIKEEDWASKIPVQDEFWVHLSECLKDHILPEFLSQFTHQIKAIIEIDPGLPEREILEQVTSYIADFLGAPLASVRIYDPNTEQMLSYGSYPSDEESRETLIPLEQSIAGEVVRRRQPYIVPNILNEDLYHDKSIIKRRGVHSLMAIPLEIPRFFPHERDTTGVIQIYYPDEDRAFSPLEIHMAEIMSRRLSYVVARKKILTMQRANEKKETIVRKVFRKLGTMEGIKMKDVFNRVITELVDIINIQSCALFSVTQDLTHVVLEAGYPESLGYHGIGKSFTINSEPAFELVLKLSEYKETSPYEIVTLSYVLVMDPQKSQLVSEQVKKFALNHNINSILYVPLVVGEEITHFMTFDAIDQRKGYTSEEIEIFLFLGQEIMKAQRIEKLDDILHDFKNPAIATAGFARRLKQILEKEVAIKEDARVKKYIDVLFQETNRLQEMALSISYVGKEEVVDLTDALKRRSEINTEAIHEQLKQNVTLEEGPFQEPLLIKCYPLHLERVLDNLLNNATNAIPMQGGLLAIRTYTEGDWACAEISNTGIISEEERLRLLEGEGRGRGLYIIHRIIRLLKGKIEIRIGKNTTNVVVRLPILSP